MKVFERLWRRIFGDPPTEIEYVEAALVRYHNRLEDIEREWRKSGGLCCPGCYSSEYYQLAKKIDRVELWLQVLKKRKNKK